jgi:uroporphyrinogen decarboxylase
MTSRERVLAACRHEQPDRVPVDLGSHPSSGIMAVAYNRLKGYLGLSEGETFVYDVVQNLAQPEDEILARFGADVVDLARVFLTEPEERRAWRLVDGSAAAVPAHYEPEPDGTGGWLVRGDEGQVIGVAPKGQPYLTQTYWPLSGGVTQEALQNLPYHMQQVTWGRAGLTIAPWYRPATDEWLAETAQRAQKLRAETDYAIMLGFGGNLMEWSQFLRGPAEFLADLAGDPQGAHRLLDRLTELHLQNLERVLGVLGPHIDIIRMGDDLGTQAGPQISAEMYREFFLPRHRQIYAAVKQYSDAFVFLHSCGGLYELMPLLIEAGVEILNPVQTSARNMEPERLKREFGKDICFWGGGCETQSTLIRGTPRQVRDQVRRRLEMFGRGGGYVFTQVHNILMDVPPQNIVAMLEAATAG